ncbi:MAG: serine/threonine protein kinase [Verrucomicrobia bacterium]|nr:serine/threonine protein kinase [Verrucomicrobiota bacterium]
MPSPPDREESLFAAAVALPAGDRAAFLAVACGEDGDLRARLSSLLSAHDSPAPLTRAPDLPADVVPPEDVPGARIGRYHLLQKIGEGGCGIVYLAEQEAPVRRPVALKVIKLGMDTKAVIARFEAERQALALMDHPNIARVLDGGATDSGRPYFVMELVRGIPLTRFCDDHRLDLVARLQIFIQVCAAVQHAHQKGVIHRDLKPSNILVTFSETGAIPKVIDFGIAKATQGRLTDATLITACDQFIGTPAYMCPEQAALTPLDIDTRCDVYALGAVLYELLSGRLQFDSQSLSGASHEELRRLICDVEPSRPSRRFRELPPEEADRIARQRATDPVRLAAALEGDLDWIALRALEKNRARRYETPTALAADLTRHLQHEPVAARPPTTAYRLGKLIRRNRLVFAAAATVALVLLAGIVVSGGLAVRAIRAERAAQAERERSSELLDFMLVDLRPLLAKAGQLGALDALASKIASFLGTSDRQDRDDRSLARRAAALTLLGTIRHEQARYPEAFVAFRTAGEHAAILCQRNPRDRDALHIRSQAEFGAGNVMFRQNRLAEARDWFGQYRDTSARLVALSPGDLKAQREYAYSQQNLVAVEQKAGNHTAARTGHLAALEVLRKILLADPADAEARSGIANANSFLGSLAEANGELAEAARRFTEQVAQYEELSQSQGEIPNWRYKHADALSFQAAVHAVTGKRAGAAAALDRAHSLLEDLVAKEPQNSRWKNALVVVHLRTALLALAERDSPRARESVAAARRAAAELAGQEKSELRFQYRLATALRIEAELQFAAGQSEAAATAREAADTGDHLLRRPGIEDEHRGERALAALLEGRLATAAGDPARARRHWQSAWDLVAPRVAESRDWRLLDPAARAALLLARPDDASSIRRRLEGLGYVPLEPWPAASSPFPAPP